MQQDLKAEKEERQKNESEMQSKISSANDELGEVREARDALLQEKNKLDAFTFEQRDKIYKLEKEVQKHKDDVQCRKQIIDEMAKNMLAHEQESMDMAQKLTLMKNQIMENDAANGMMKRHPAVRLGRIRHHPCTVSKNKE